MLQLGCLHFLTLYGLTVSVLVLQLSCLHFLTWYTVLPFPCECSSSAVCTVLPSVRSYRFRVSAPARLFALFYLVCGPTVSVLVLQLGCLHFSTLYATLPFPCECSSSAVCAIKLPLVVLTLCQYSTQLFALVLPIWLDCYSGGAPARLFAPLLYLCGASSGYTMYYLVE